MKFSKDSFFKSNRLGLHLGPVKSQSKVDYKLTCPFARSWIAILITAAIAAIFSVSGYSVLEDAISSWQGADNFFNLVIALFTTFWLIGWSLGAIIPLVVLVVMISGRQVLLIHSGQLDFIIGIPGLAFRISGAADEVTDVRLVEYDSKSIFPKGGMQIEIETSSGDKDSPFGSNMTSHDVKQIQSAIARNKMLPHNLDPDPRTEPKTVIDLSSNTQPQQFINNNQPNTHTKPVTLGSASTLFLIVANLVPLLGVFLFNWDLGSTMVLYWAETAIILFYTVAKGIVANKILGIIGGVFTISHAGAFMAIHLLFIWTLFVQQTVDGDSFGSQSTAEVFAYLAALWPALLSLFISHGYSFKTNFLDKRHRSPKKSKNEREPFYSRIILMHMTIIIGGGLSLILGDGALALSLLIIMKIIVDVKAHLNHHSGKQAKKA